ncbi:hypothetical protein Bca4012_018331 [Brassica carinata]|uniref:Uncharacterized protein n=1 Tax=Brassica carinata TaxID=52824 RepID=A0A8X8BEL6_BRACI|nr:hypothetical protein Bca52824_003275 [Brassica carinata]
MSSGGDGGDLQFPDLTVELFVSTYEAASKALRDWDLDSAADSIEPDVAYAKASQEICDMDALDALSTNPDSNFCQFCKSKYLILIHPKMEASFFGNLDQRDYVTGGGHPRTARYSIWLLHRLAYLFDPAAKIFQYMESVVKNIVVDEKENKPRIGGNVIQSRVYVSGVKVVEWKGGSGLVLKLITMLCNFYVSTCYKI